MFKKTFVIMIISSGLMFMSCMSMSDNVVQTIDEESFQETETLLNESIRYYLGLPLKESEETINSQLEKLLNVQTFNLDYKARIIGINALWNDLHGHKIKSRSMIKDLEETGRLDELLYITRSLNSEEPIKELEKGLEELYEPRYLHFFLGEAYFKEGDFGKATTEYEKCPPGLDSDIQDMIDKRIDAGLKLYNQNEISSKELNILSKEHVTLGDFMNLLHSESDLYSRLIGTSKEDTATNWKSANLLENNDNLESVLLRKKLADVLYRLAAYKENPETLENYSTSSNSDSSLEMSIATSPISDVSLNDAYFQPIIFVIEREWINMIDGEHFKPNQEVTGQELLAIIDELKEYYSLKG
ncbi:hypothetical protein [Spirochaeta cellobiosiphila]|uniref:hypothetical protein n=1 Tax=Spirochaeta cellobiosiphila TaxID=504483 RepID=UPI000412AD76|nr:hypothetical protein [Spirochaeta cellobiosiphila]